MGIMLELAQAVEELDWNLPTDIQAEGIPIILGGGDVLMVVYETVKDLQEGRGQKSVQSGSVTVSSKWKMNVFDRTPAMAIDTKEGLLCQSHDPQGWLGTRSNKGVTTKGKYYYEATITDEGLCRIGWSTMRANLDLGTDREGFGFGGTGKKSFGKQFDSYGESFGLSDVIGCYLDLDSLAVKWSKNGVDFGKAYDITASLKNSVFYAAVCLKMT